MALPVGGILYFPASAIKKKFNFTFFPIKLPIVSESVAQSKESWTSS
jgi:hypothetical protein